MRKINKKGSKYFTHLFVSQFWFQNNGTLIMAVDALGWNDLGKCNGHCGRHLGPEKLVHIW